MGRMDCASPALLRLAEDLRNQTLSLHKEVQELRDESAALRECLETLGILPEGDVRSALCRRRGAAALRAVLQTQELVLAIGCSAGLTAARALTEAVLPGSDIRPLLPNLADLLPPRVCVVGGYPGMTSSPTARPVLADLAAMLPPQVSPPPTTRWLGPADGAASSWGTLPPMPTRRTGCAAAAVAGKLYVAGGVDGTGQVLGSVECFDPDAGCWTTLPPMTTRRWRCAAAAVRGQLWVVGGESESGQRLNAVECFDLETMCWSTFPCMPTRRVGCAAAGVDGCLCVVGGHDSAGARLDIVDIFDPRDGMLLEAKMAEDKA